MTYQSPEEAGADGAGGAPDDAPEALGAGSPPEESETDSLDNSDDMDQTFIDELVKEADPSSSTPEGLSDKSPEGAGSDTPDGEEKPASEADGEGTDAAPPAAPPTNEDAPPAAPEPKQEEVPPTPEEQQANYEALHVNWVKGLEAKYAITDEEADEFVTKPEIALPKMAARVHAEAIAESLKAVQTVLPQIIANQIRSRPDLVTGIVKDATDADAQAEVFYAANTWARGNEKLILQAGQMVEAQFPTLGTEEKLAKTLEISRGALGVSDKPPASKPPAEVRPFTPASSGGSSTRLPSVDGDNVWSEFIN